MFGEVEAEEGEVAGGCGALYQASVPVVLVDVAVVAAVQLTGQEPTGRAVPHLSLQHHGVTTEEQRQRELERHKER